MTGEEEKQVTVEEMTHYKERIPAELILKQIKKYGPISAMDLANFFGVKKNIIQSSVARLRKKGEKIKSVRLQKNKKKQQYVMEEVVPKKPESPAFLPVRRESAATGINCFVDRCYYLIKALEHCSSTSIMDSFNLSEEEARVLVNKVVAKYKDVAVSFSANIKKG